jgi:NDP-sugar pyrophosphorylase family protein
MQIIIPMAGAGSRFQKVGIKMPKPLIQVAGKTLIEHSINSFNVDAKFIFVTRKSDDEDIDSELSTLLKKLRPESVQIQTDFLTSGASQTCLLAQSEIDPNDELVIYNCDQIIRWNPNDFLTFVHNNACDGAVVLYHSKDPKNSFAEVIDGQITKLIEKNPISDNALIGFHYWRYARDFIESAKALTGEFQISGRPECYISETYNFMIASGKNIAPYWVSPNVYVPLGTPEDVNLYIGKIKEYYQPKPKTIFCDIDGTLLKHNHTISDVLTTSPESLSGVLTKINEWDSIGHRIILVTARKESTRNITEQHLQSLGIAYDQLIMGVTNGARVLINDKLLPDDPDRAIAVNVQTDQGFKNIDWEGFGL